MIKTIKTWFRAKIPAGWLNFYHWLQGFWAAVYFGFPGRRLQVIGVTGTGGKTTTCHLIDSILRENGEKVCLASTVQFRLGKKSWTNESKMTMLPAWELQKFLRQAVKEGCRWAILETTSHAIRQYRNLGIKYYISVFTNLTHDHLDYHQDFQDYKQAKLKIFQQHPWGIIANLDDKNGQEFLEQPATKKLSYGLSQKADLTARKIILEPQETLFTAVTPQGQTPIRLRLPGQFNISNCLAAIGAGLLAGGDLETIKKGVEKVEGVAGRMELITNNNRRVLIDYAHAPDSLEKVYATLRPITKGKLIAVLGACGDRDKTKRPIMGALASRWADIVILTNEDPYHENPMAIIEQVAVGVPRGVRQGEKRVLNKNFWKIFDRRRAIRKALQLSTSKDDLVVLTGKGAETCIVWGEKKEPWSERQVVEEELAKLR